MKVKELIQILSKQDPGLDVVCYSEDTELANKVNGLSVFEITDVSVQAVEKIRDKSGKASLKFQTNDAFANVVIVNITGDF